MAYAFRRRKARGAQISAQGYFNPIWMEMKSQARIQQRGHPQRELPT